MKIKNKPWFPAFIFFLALCLFGAFLRCTSVPEAKAGDTVLINTIAMKILVEERRQSEALEKIAQELARIRKQH
jgi:hypothetical protein